MPSGSAVPVYAGVTGPFPRPEALVQATRDLDRGRIAPADGDAAFARADADVAAVEERLRLDVRTGGYLRWDDLFRPFTRLWEGASPGPLTRFFETNTFYRQPVLTQRPKGGSGRLANWLPSPLPGARAIVPGPYTFSTMAEVAFSGRGHEPIERIAEAIAAEIRALGADGPAQWQFQEPMLVYAPPADDGESVVRAYRTIAEAAPSTPKIVWTYFGDAARTMPLLARLPVDGVGFDLFETDPGATEPLRNKAIGLGCLDARSTVPESVPDVARLVREVIRIGRPSSVWLGPSPPLDLLPFDAAVRKLEVLPPLREALR